MKICSHCVALSTSAHALPCLSKPSKTKTRRSLCNARRMWYLAMDTVSNSTPLPTQFTGPTRSRLSSTTSSLATSRLPLPSPGPLPPPRLTPRTPPEASRALLSAFPARTAPGATRSIMSVPAATAIPTPSAATAAAPPSTRSTAHVSKFLAKLQEQYEQGTFCDVRVRCVVLPDPKSREQGAALRQEQQNDTTDILCHAVVLCARSPYFASSLSGKWNEAQTKTVEVVLEDDQAVQDMKLLIKQCYSGSYIQDEEELLDLRTRMRLAFLGNAFEMQECVWECLESLKEGLTLTDAVTVLQEVPEELRGHEAMACVTEKVVAILSKALNEFTEFDPPTTIQKDWKQRIGDALANALGPVNQLFGESPWHKLPDDSFYTCLPLKPHILAHSLTAMEALLASDALHVSTENEVYTLLGCWIHQTPHLAAGYENLHPLFWTNRLAPFKRLVKLVRLHHLSSEYLANVVTACPLATLSTLLPFILCSSLIMRDRDAGVRGKGIASSLGAMDRGRGGAGWTYSSTLKLSDLLPLTRGAYLHKYLGLVDGYPIRIQPGRTPAKTGVVNTFFGMYVTVVMPVWTTGTWEGGASRRASLEYNLGVGTTRSTLWLKHGFDGVNAFGISNFLMKHWEEIIHKKSDLFSDGQITVEAKMRLPSEGEPEK